MKFIIRGKIFSDALTTIRKSVPKCDRLTISVNGHLELIASITIPAKGLRMLEKTAEDDRILVISNTTGVHQKMGDGSCHVLPPQPGRFWLRLGLDIIQTVRDGNKPFVLSYYGRRECWI